jgi:hypothetical protein
MPVALEGEAPEVPVQEVGRHVPDPPPPRGCLDDPILGIQGTENPDQVLMEGCEEMRRGNSTGRAEGHEASQGLGRKGPEGNPGPSGEDHPAGDQKKTGSRYAPKTSSMA